MGWFSRTYQSTVEEAISTEIKWCKDDDHVLYENYPDFNVLIDEDDSDIRINHQLENVSQASKALYAGDLETYRQEFNLYRSEQYKSILGEDFITEQLGDNHWYNRNVSRFDKLVLEMTNGLVVPFVGAGISVEGGFPSWKNHLREQGRTAGLDAERVEQLLNEGKFEEIIGEIEGKGYRDTFIQEITDVFSVEKDSTETTFRINELFQDTIITTNYDKLIEQVIKIKGLRPAQVITALNVNEKFVPSKTTVIKLHGDIDQPANCVLGKNQYDETYGNGKLNLKKPIPKLLSSHYRMSSLLFLGCSLNQDRTMEVFQAVKDQTEETGRRPHYTLESLPETEEELVARNAYLTNMGIAPIWFPSGQYEYIERILQLAINELRYQGYDPAKTTVKQNSSIASEIEEVITGGFWAGLRALLPF
jgi:NAD-dependent SIR2 family protein deacetylase